MSPVRPSVQVVGRRMEAEHYRLRDFLTRTAQPYEWHEAGSTDADQLLEKVGLEGASLPVVIDGEQTLQAATVESIMAAWGGNQPAGESAHPIIRSAEPGEPWSWCYIDEVAFAAARP